MSKHHNNNNGQNQEQNQNAENLNETPVDENLENEELNESSDELGGSEGDTTEVSEGSNPENPTDDKGEKESSENEGSGIKPETNENKDENSTERKSVESKKVNPVRWISKDIVAIDIVHNKSETLREKLRVELIDGKGDIVTILSDGKYYRIPKNCLF